MMMMKSRSSRVVLGACSLALVSAFGCGSETVKKHDSGAGGSDQGGSSGSGGSPVKLDAAPKFDSASGGSGGGGSGGGGTGGMDAGVRDSATDMGGDTARPVDARDGGPAAVWRCQPPVGLTPDDEPPKLLSQTGCTDPMDVKKPNLTVLVAYRVVDPLWSDHADKQRWMHVPAGMKVHVMDCTKTPTECAAGMPGGDGHWSFPVGSVLVKEFGFGGVKVETRLFVRFSNDPQTGWVGYSYMWNQAQTDATLVARDDGRVMKDFMIPGMAMPVTWNYPSRDDCVLCHTAYNGRTIGPETKQLNYMEGAMNQLDRLKPLVDALPTPYPASYPTPYPSPTQGLPMATGTVEQKARAYLHANCAICHRPDGNFPKIDLRYSTPYNMTNLNCVGPNKGDLGVTNSRIVWPGNPGMSLIWLRMQAKDMLGGRMPQIASVVVDKDGSDAVAAWIKAMPAANCPPL